MKIFSTTYSLALGGIALWAWASYFIYEGSAREHLLPAMALNFLTLPSFLLIEELTEYVPWLLNSQIAMLSLVTGFGGIQAAVVWLVAARFKFSIA